MESSQAETPKHRKELVIPVIGMTGAGKSTFINHVLGQEGYCAVGTTLELCTTELKTASITFDDSELKLYTTIPTLKDYNFVIVDTPGFNNGKMPDDVILTRLVQYLKDSKKVLGGIIYLHEICRDRLPINEAGLFLKQLERCYGIPITSKVVFGITKRGRAETSTLQSKQTGLSETFWSSMIAEGAQVLNFEDTRSSSLQFLESIVNAWQEIHSLQEIVIPVMGTTGAGKSTFINRLLGKDHMRIGHDVVSCTRSLEPVTVKFDTLALKNYRITIVDTPGFDEPFSDLVIFQNLTEWLRKSYQQNAVLGGVIYLHDISDKRLSDAARQNLQGIISMCGDAAARKVVIGTTKWENISPDQPDCLANDRQAELKSVYWKSMIEKGTRVLEFHDNRDSAIEFIEVIVRNMMPGTFPTSKQSDVGANRIIPGIELASPKPNKEVVILVMGTNGAGKSTFIDHLLGSENSCAVWTRPDPCAKTYSISFGNAKLESYPTVISILEDYVFTIVDTSELNEDKTANNLIIKNLIKYLKDGNLALGGIIYLHDITSTMVPNESRNILKQLQDKCKGAKNAKVILGATKGQRLSDPTDSLDKQLNRFKGYWSSVIERGAHVLRFEENHESALLFLECIVNVRQEIIIPVVGPTCVGKSSFINYLVGENVMGVDHGLTRCTDTIQSATIFLNTPILQNYAITVVDTPGFDDTYTSDALILRSVAEWLEKSYRQKKVLGGVIYLHDISSDRFSGTARQNLPMFNHMCGDPGLRKFVIGTTKWKRTSLAIAERHQKELESIHWESMIQKGTNVLKFQDSRESAIQFIEVIVSKMKLDTYLAIQSELVDDKKIIAESKTVQEHTLQEMLEMQKKMVNLGIAIARREDPDAQEKLAETMEKIKKLDSQIRKFEIPSTPKLRRLLKLL